MTYKVITMPQTQNNDIEKLQSWMWLDGDTGTYGGPLNDWRDNHAEKWFKHITGKRLAIQAGGALGMYPRMLGLQFEMVYTFEPSPASFHCLVNNCQVDNVVKLNAALGDKIGMIEVECKWPDNVGMNTVKILDAQSFKIPQLTIDTFNFPACDLIALDVEGYEDKIINGAIETIKKFHPVITGENSNRPEINDVLFPLGYRIIEQSVADSIFVYNK